MAMIILLMTITVLFGGWVWTLKQEMRVLRRRLAPPEVAEPEPSRVTRDARSEHVIEHVHQHRPELRPAHVPVSGNGVRVQRNFNGVQTFMIDA